MRELPILMNGAMVRAVLEGRKTVTRRLVKPLHGRTPVDLSKHGIDTALCEYTGRHNDPTSWGFPGLDDGADLSLDAVSVLAPYRYGDRLYVRETTVNVEDHGYLGPVFAVSDEGVAIREGGLGPAEDDCEVEPEDIKLRTALHMPKAWARIWLEVTAVRVERLRDITPEQAIAEGMRSNLREHDAVESLRNDFAQLWNGLAKAGSRWDDNPWVWVVEFRRIEHVPGQVTADYRGSPISAEAVR